MPIRIATKAVCITELPPIKCIAFRIKHADQPRRASLFFSLLSSKVIYSLDDRFRVASYTTRNRASEGNETRNGNTDINERTFYRPEPRELFEDWNEKSREVFFYSVQSTITFSNAHPDIIIIGRRSKSFIDTDRANMFTVEIHV